MMLLIPDNHPDRAMHLNSLGSMWLRQYEQAGGISAIENACACLVKAVELTPDGDPNTPFYLAKLGYSLQYRFEQLGNLADIEKAIKCVSQAVELTPDSHPSKPVHLNNLGNSRHSRFMRFGNLANNDKAIECYSRAVELTLDSHINIPDYLSNLARSWQGRFKRLGSLTNIDKVVECGLRAVELTPDGHTDKPSYLNILGVSWKFRFGQLGNLADLDKSIECYSQAVELTPDGRPSKPGYLSNLAGSWLSRFERLGSLTNINKAIECGSRAVELTPDDHPNKPGYLAILGNSYQGKFQRFGNLSNIGKAVECASQAVDLAPDDHPDKPGCLNNLGDLWRDQFERLGNVADIDKAINCVLQAVELTPDDSPGKRACLDSIGRLCLTRFERLGNLADIDRSTECASGAADLTPDGHPGKPGLLSGLGASLHHRFKRLKNLVDIEKAIECASQSVDLTPDDHPNKPIYLANLGSLWINRFEQLGNLADSDKAIECASQAVHLIPDGHLNKPSCLSNLGNTWRSRFEQLGNLADIDKAIEYCSQAVELTPEGHPAKAARLNSLGSSWYRRFEQHGGTEDLEVCTRCFQNGAETAVTNPSAQRDCALDWAKLSFQLGRSPLSAYQRAFALLPHIVSLGQTIQERYSSLLSISDLAAEAAAWAVSVELYNLALEWLEQGRSIVWNQTLQLRTPFGELAKADSNLAHRMRQTASQLDAASSRSQAANMSVEPHQNLESQAQLHRRTAELWDGLLAEARQLPGFHDFMLPRTPAELKKAATDGPVVVINTHSTRCDALIIFPQCDNIQHIPLVHLTNEQLTATCTRVISIVGCRGTSARSVTYFPPVVESQNRLKPLADLWFGVVGPVLDALACTRQQPYDQLPHVTWCATGALSFVPLHAAGLYDGQSPNTLDLVVSSYTPTLSALLSRNDQTVGQTQGVLAVGQANTRGQPPLPMTVEELAIVKKHTNATFYHQLDESLATVEATLDAMEQHSWVHLACHAVQNRDNPSHSAFYLHDGCLTLEEIAKRAFKNKGLAFLSACQTATGDNHLPDEATHLAAGMLTAGYPSVIATMWSIMDEDAPQVAEEVYAELMKDGKMDHRNAARALHKAVGKLREKVGLESIDRWAPFIHVGV